MGKLSRGDWIEVFEDIIVQRANAHLEWKLWNGRTYYPDQSLFEPGREPELEARWVELGPANAIKYAREETAKKAEARVGREWQRLWRKSLTWKDEALSLAMLEWFVEWEGVRAFVKEMNDHRYNYRPVDELVNSSPLPIERLRKDPRILQARMRAHFRV